MEWVARCRIPVWLLDSGWSQERGPRLLELYLPEDCEPLGASKWHSDTKSRRQLFSSFLNGVLMFDESLDTKGKLEYGLQRPLCIPDKNIYQSGSCGWCIKVVSEIEMAFYIYPHPSPFVYTRETYASVRVMESSLVFKRKRKKDWTGAGTCYGITQSGWKPLMTCIFCNMDRFFKKNIMLNRKNQKQNKIHSYRSWK